MHARASRHWSVCCAAAIWIAAGAIAQGADRHLEFLHGLQQRGYGELSLYYLESLGAGDALPEPLRPIWDLEMARSLRAAAAEARSTQTRDQLEDRAQTHLDAFSKQHPTDPTILFSFNSWGATSLDRAVARAGLNAAQPVAVSSKVLELARTEFDEARRYFEDSLERNKQIAAAAPADNEVIAQRLRGARIEASLRLHLVDFWTALLLRLQDNASPESRELLKSAAAAFERFSKENEEDSAALVASYWRARCLSELGEHAAALEVCDDVLGYAPESEEDQATPTELQFFAEALQLKLQTLAKLNRDNDVITAANAWVKANAKQASAPGSEVIVLELAKARLRAASKLPEAEQNAAKAAALKLLARVAAEPGSHQYEALKLQREQSSTGESGSVTDLLAFAKLAERQRNWTDVEQAYRDAIAALEKPDPARRVKLPEIQEQLAESRLRQAESLLAAGEGSQALEVTQKIIDELPKTTSAPRAAALALAYSKRQFLQASESEREPHLERLEELTKLISSRWPNRPEADDARLAMAQATVAMGDTDQGVELYSALPATSARYRVARLAAGQLLWRDYQALMRKVAKDEPRPPAADELLARAEKLFQEALDPKSKSPAATEEVVAEGSVLLAQLSLERNAVAEARQLLDPQVKRLGPSQLSAASPATLRLIHTYVRAELIAGDRAAAEALVLKFAQAAPDSSEVNNVLVDALRQLLRKPAAESAAPAEISPAVRQLGELLARREELSPVAKIIVADACLADNPERARTLYDSVLALAEKDQAVQQQLGGDVPRIRTRLIKLLRDQRHYVVALRQIEELMKTQPKRLDLWMEKGNILQSCAATDPKYFEPALAHWTEVRRLLGARRGPEYFEAVYFAAFDLYRLGQVNKTPERWQQARQLLKATLITAPQLSSEEQVKQYRELMQKLDDAAGKPADKAAP